MIGLEAQIVFWTSCFFTVIYILKQHYAWGILSFTCWFTLGWLWLILVAEPMQGSANIYATYAVALLFHAIGFLFLLLSLAQIFRSLNPAKYEESDLD